MLYSCSLCLNWAETAASFALSFATMVSKPQQQFVQAKHLLSQNIQIESIRYCWRRNQNVSNCPAFQLHRVEKLAFLHQRKFSSW